MKLSELPNLEPLRLYQSDKYSDQYYVYIGKKHINISYKYHSSYQKTFEDSGYMFIELTSPEIHWLEKKILPVEAIINNHLYGGKIAFLNVVHDNKFDIGINIHLDETHKSCSLTNKFFTVGPTREDSNEYEIIIEDIE